MKLTTGCPLPRLHTVYLKLLKGQVGAHQSSMVRNTLYFKTFRRIIVIFILEVQPSSLLGKKNRFPVTTKRPKCRKIFFCRNMRIVGYTVKCNPKFFFTSENHNVQKVKKLKCLILTPSKSHILEVVQQRFCCLLWCLQEQIRPEFVRSEPITEVTEVTVESRGFRKTLSHVRQMTHVIYSILGKTYFSNSSVYKCRLTP